MTNDTMTHQGPAGSLEASGAIRHSPPPWWRHGHVWLVISGPAVVVVACFVTAWIAVRTADPLVTEDYYRQGVEINRQLARERALMPATQARNHAATPTRP